MTSVYKFKAGYTKIGVATTPSSVPTITISDGTNILVTGSATTAYPLTGLYSYSYTGTASLDLVGLFHTSDATMDSLDLFSHVPDITTNSVESIWSSATRTLTSFGTLIADIWTNATRTLSAFGFTVATNSDANVTTIVTDYARRTGDYSVLTAGLVDTQLSNTHGTGSWLSGGGGGATASDVWTYGTRTLTQTAPVVIQSLLDNSQINVYKSTTFDVTLTNLPNFAGWQKIWFTVKEDSNYEVPDSESIIQIQLTAPTGTVTDGLLYINHDPATLTDGYLTAISTTSLQMKVKAGVTGNVPPKTLYYGIKYINSAGDIVALSDGGEFVIRHSTSKKVT